MAPWKSIRYSTNTYPICDSPLSRSARRSLAPLQKSRWNHRSFVWTEALSSMVFVAPRKAIRYQGMNTYPICDCRVESLARRSLAPLQKRRRNHRAYVWTEALSGMVFVPAQKLSGILQTYKSESPFTICIHGHAIPNVMPSACHWVFLNVYGQLTVLLLP